MNTERFRLLCVDDESNILDLFRRVFRGTYDILTADGGQAAIESLRRQPVDVVLSDQRMPGVTGVEVLKFARQQQPDAVRILVTAYADMASLVKSVNEAGIFKYLSKPIDLDELQTAVVEALESVRTERRLKAMMPSPIEFLAQCERDAAIVRRLGRDIAAATATAPETKQGTMDRVLRILSMFVKINIEGQNRFMQYIRYPGTDVHRNQHKELSDALVRIKVAFSKSEDVQDDVKKLHTILVDRHIAISDAALGDFVKRNLPDIP